MTTSVRPRQVSGGEHEHGHLEEFRTDPIALMQRVRTECGDVGQFRLADKDVILLTGAEANEFKRTSSRLIEMSSKSYLALPHGHKKDSVASGTSTGLVET